MACQSAAMLIFTIGRAGLCLLCCFQLRVARLAMPGKGWLSQLCKKNSTYSHLTVLLRMAPAGGPADARLTEDLRFRLAANGAALPGSPQLELQPDQQGQEVVLEITDGMKVLAR